MVRGWTMALLNVRYVHLPFTSGRRYGISGCHAIYTTSKFVSDGIVVPRRLDLRFPHPTEVRLWRSANYNCRMANAGVNMEDQCCLDRSHGYNALWVFIGRLDRFEQAHQYTCAQHDCQDIPGLSPDTGCPSQRLTQTIRNAQAQCICSTNAPVDGWSIYKSNLWHKDHDH